MTRRTAPLALFATVTFLGLLVFGADRAAASPLSCGDTITRDTTLKRDLTDCPGNGIVIGADNITLDLNGHTIDGDDQLGCPDFYACDYGVDNTAGHHGVTIEDGSIREFATAGFVLGADHNRLRRLAVSHNILGGLLLIESPGARIDHNAISANGLTTDQAGLIVFDSGGVRIEENSVTDNGDIGLFLIGLSDGRLRGDSVSGNPEAGMIVDGSGNEISRERVSRNGDGIIVSGDGNRVAGNHVSDALGCPEGGCGFGISLEGGQGNLITRNLVTHGRQADIRVADFEAEGGPPAVDNVVSRNLVTDAIGRRCARRVDCDRHACWSAISRRRRR